MTRRVTGKSSSGWQGEREVCVAGRITGKVVGSGLVTGKSWSDLQATGKRMSSLQGDKDEFALLVKV